MRGGGTHREAHAHSPPTTKKSPHRTRSSHPPPKKRGAFGTPRGNAVPSPPISQASADFPPVQRTRVDRFSEDYRRTATSTRNSARARLPGRGGSPKELSAGKDLAKKTRQSIHIHLQHPQQPPRGSAGLRSGSGASTTSQANPIHRAGPSCTAGASTARTWASQPPHPEIIQRPPK